MTELTQQDLQTVLGNVQKMGAIMDTCKDGKLPLKDWNQYQALLHQTSRMLGITTEEPAPNWDLLNDKMTAYSRVDVRREEIEQHAKGTPLLTVQSKEGAYRAVIDRLAKIGNEGEVTPENLSFIAAVLFEVVLQFSTKPYDFRVHPDLVIEYQKAWAQRRNEIWAATCQADWSQICQKYEATKEFRIECEKYFVQPCILNEHGEVDLEYDTKPLENNPGLVQTYEKAELAVHEKDLTDHYANIPLDQRKYFPLSFSLLRAANWVIGLYSCMHAWFLRTSCGPVSKDSLTLNSKISDRSMAL